MWVTMKFMLFSMMVQFIHLFLKLHGTREMDLKAMITSEESVSIHKFLHPLWFASSTALMTADISAWKAVPPPKFSAKQARKIASWFLKIPPQDEVMLFDAPSVLHLIQLTIGGYQITSMMLGALGAWIFMLNFLKMIKSLWDEDEALEVLLPERATADIMELMEDLQWKDLLSNLFWFLVNHRLLIILIMITTLHCGDQLLSHNVHIYIIHWLKLQRGI